MASAITDALHSRGVTDPAARLTAQAGVAVFKVAFERWIADTDDTGLAQLIGESLDALKTLTAGTQS